MERSKILKCFSCNFTSFTNLITIFVLDFFHNSQRNINSIIRSKALRYIPFWYQCSCAQDKVLSTHEFCNSFIKFTKHVSFRVYTEFLCFACNYYITFFCIFQYILHILHIFMLLFRLRNSNKSFNPQAIMYTRQKTTHTCCFTSVWPIFLSFWFIYLILISSSF